MAINMEDTESVGSNSGSDDSAAIAAVAGFWDSDKEAAAAKEVPDSVPATTGHTRALAQELVDQADAEAQEAESSQEPEPKQVTQKNEKAATGRPAPQAPVKTEGIEPGLDPVLRSIAQDAGWTDEQIDDFYGANPELAQRTFDQMADTFATLSRQFLEVPAQGMMPQAATPQAVQPAQVSTQQNAAGQLPSLLTDEALKKFGEENGESAANLLKGMRDHFSGVVSAQEARIQKFEQQAKAAELRAVGQEAESVIAQLREKYPTVYGKTNDPKTLTLEQSERMRLLGLTADAIRAGAEKQGRSLSVKDALLQANYIVSRESVRTETRKEILGQVKQRASRATARPTQRNSPSAPGQGRSDEAAIAAAAEHMALIGLNDSFTGE